MKTSLTQALASKKNAFRLAFSRRMLVTLLLGFSSGLPLALTGITLQAWFTTAGISIAAVGSLTLIGQPYVYKFLWAPLFDRFQLGILGRRRGWILLMQCLLVIGLILMSFLHPGASAWKLGFVALMVAVFSASQDISIDAYRTDLLEPDERGLGSAMLVGGYRAAMLVSGGLAVALAAKIGFHGVYRLMALLMAMQILVTLWGPEPKRQAEPENSLYETVIMSFKEFLTRRNAFVILIFIVLYKLGDAFVLSLGTPFLLRGLHFSLVDVGLIYKTVGMGATLLGAFIGGFWMARLSLYRALLYFGLLQALSNLAFLFLAIVGKNYIMMVMTIFIESFCGGLGTIAFMAFLMALCDARFTATQYALFSALSVIGRTFIGPIAGIMMLHMSWAEFYFWSFLTSFPALALLVWMKNRIDLNTPVSKEVLS